MLMTQDAPAGAQRRRQPPESRDDGLPRQARETLPLSAFIICKDEEKYLGACIESLSQCREIVIVDSGSADGTESLVQRYIDDGWPIRFMVEKWRGYARQKQFAMEQCSQPWLVSIDADERLDDALKEALPRLLQAPEHVAGYRIPRRPYLIGRGYTPSSSCERGTLRLLRNGRGAFDLNLRVHEGIIADGQVIQHRGGSMLHYRPLPIDEQILKENKYSTLKADQLVDAGARPRRLRLMFNPPIYFLRLYFRNGLWRCGFPGFIQAMTAAVYSFLTEAKIYQRVTLKNLPCVDDLDRHAAG